MSRNNDGCSLFSLAALVIFSVIFAFDGKPEFLYFVLGIFAVLLLIVGIGNLTTPKNNLPPNKTIVFEKHPQPLKQKAAPATKPQPYYIFDTVVKGRIESEELPADIRRLNCIERLELSTNHNIEISGFINKNINLKSITLRGPFWLKNPIIRTDQLISVSLDYNHNIKSFLEKLSNQTNLRELNIADSSLLQLPDNLYCVHNLYRLSICSKLEVFPRELLKIENLIELNLSGNKIKNIPKQIINRDLIDRSKLQKLDLSNNLLRIIPFDIFQIKSLGKIVLNKNPLKVRFLKKLYNNYLNKISLDENQKAIGSRTLHPVAWKIIIALIVITVLLIPYVFFDNWGLSLWLFVMGLLVYFSERIKF